jgi:hypothetical protein
MEPIYQCIGSFLKTLRNRGWRNRGWRKIFEDLLETGILVEDLLECDFLFHPPNLI